MWVGVHNFRDAGGYRVAAGVFGQTSLFRPGRLTAATGDDEGVLPGLGIKAVVDLRRGAERDAHPTGSWAAACEAITNDVGGHADSLRSAGPSTAADRDY